MGSHPNFSSTGPSIGYTPKTTDESDSSLGGTVVPHVNAQQSGTWAASIVDGVLSSNKATVAQFHNADNQNPGASGYGLLTGGIAQLLNAAGNLDRARSAAVGNNIAATGLAAETLYGQYNTTLPIVATGNYAAAQIDASGRLLVGSIASALPAGTNAIGTVGVTALPALPAGTNAIGTVALGAGTAAVGTVGVTALPALPAGTNAIGTVGVTALPAIPAGTNAIGTVTPTTNADTAALVTLSAAAAGANSADQANLSARGAMVVISVTAITGTSPTLTVTVQGKDAASGAYYTLLASAAISAVGTTVLQIYPGSTAAANAAANVPLPRTWRVITTIAGTTPAVTATVGASLIV